MHGQRVNAAGQFVGECRVHQPMAGDEAFTVESLGNDDHLEMRFAIGRHMVIVAFVHDLQVRRIELGGQLLFDDFFQHLPSSERLRKPGRARGAYSRDVPGQPKRCRGHPHIWRGRRARRRFRASAPVTEYRGNIGVVDEVRQSITAEHENVVRAEGDEIDVRFDEARITDVAGNDVLLRMAATVFFVDLARVDGFLDDAMVAAELVECVTVPPVGTGVPTLPITTRS